MERLVWHFVAFFSTVYNSLLLVHTNTKINPLTRNNTLVIRLGRLTNNENIQLADPVGAIVRSRTLITQFSAAPTADNQWLAPAGSATCQTCVTTLCDVRPASLHAHTLCRKQVAFRRRQAMGAGLFRRVCPIADADVLCSVRYPHSPVLYV